MNRSLNSFSRLVLVLAFVTTAGQAKSLAALADSWKADWEQTVAAAKKEGEVSFYGSQVRRRSSRSFNKNIPRSKLTQ